MSVKINLDDVVNKAIIWQKCEFPVAGYMHAYYYRYPHRVFIRAKSATQQLYSVTNQRSIFVAKVGMFSKIYEVNCTVNLEDIVSISIGKIVLFDTLILNQQAR